MCDTDVITDEDDEDDELLAELDEELYGDEYASIASDDEDEED